METLDKDRKPSSSPKWSAWISCALLAALLVYFGIVYSGIIHSTQGVITERDGFYHARYAQMLPQRGLSRTLPWMQFTDWKDKFCDKDPLYHLFLAPFCTNAKEPLPGAKSATIALFLFALGALYFVLKRWRAPFPLAWVALLAVGSANF